MGSPENFGTNSASSSNGGIMPPSLLESASLGAALDDNSALISLQKTLSTPSGSDPINSELASLKKSKNFTEDNQSSQDSTNYTSPGSDIFGQEHLSNQPQSFINTSLFPSSNNKNSNKAKDKDSLTGNAKDTTLVGITEQNSLATGVLGIEEQSQQNSSSSAAKTNSSASTTNQTTIPNFAIRTESTISINGSGDFDGVPTSLSDDALIYAAKGFTINGNPTLPVQRDADGNPIRDASGKLILVDKAVAVTAGYTVTNGPSNQYAGLIPPTVVPQQTVTVPAYADIKQLELTKRIPNGTPTVTFNISQNPINNANDWLKKFPPPGTANNPTVVRVTGGGLNIPANVTLNNYVITVEQGDINFNGNGHNFNNVILVANNGNINLSNVQARDLSVFASGSINMNGGARFAGSSLLANSSNNGNITFNGATSSTNTTDSLKVISQGDITYNGASNTRGLFLSVKNFTFNGSSTLYGSISAKGNIIFNGKATVIAVAELMPDITAPVITADLARDTAPLGQTNTDKITFDPAIAGTVIDASPILEFRAGFNNTPVANYTQVIAQRNSNGSFSFTRAQLETIYGGTLLDGIYTLHLQAKDLYGNLSNSFDVTFTLDTTTPSPSNLDLSAIDDSGTSNTDNITNKKIPTITGNAEVGAVVQLFNQGQLLGQSTADNTGVWQIVTSDLTDGTYHFTARSTDIAGNVSNASAPLSITIDTTLPQLVLAEPIDKAPLKQGAKLTGSVNGTGSTVTALSYRFDNFAPIAVSLNATGGFDQELDFTSLSNGSHTLTITATDNAGNVTTTQYNVTLALDKQAPTITATLVRDTGTNNTDGITSDPTITGTVIDANQVVEFRAGFENTSVTNFVSVLPQRQADGSFRFDRNKLESIYGGTLPDGVHTLRLLAIDEYGNSSNVFNFTFTLDSTPPQQLVLRLDLELDSTNNSNLQTTAATVSLIGKTEANATVVLQETGSSVKADATGNFQFTGIDLKFGANPVSVSITDAAGNESVFNKSITRLTQTDVVLDWNATLLKAIQTDRTAPPLASRNMAIVHAAIYDAVNAITRTHSVYHVDANAPVGTSAAAAAAEAAYRVLVNLYPLQKATFDVTLAASLAAIPDGQAEDDGIALGQRVADEILAWRSTDGSKTVLAYTPTTNPGDWQPTPSGYGAALLPQWPEVTPFAMTAGSQFRPAGPPALDSDQYADEFNQVKELGKSNSTTRTAEQTEIARFWADGAGTYTPPGHWNKIAETVALERGNTLEENARLFALLNIGLADAGIAAWDAKYTYDFWRPVTAIRQADNDNKPATISDPTWTPLLQTPPFPEYVSGHSTFSGVADVILTNFFGSDFSFTTTSAGLPGVARSFDNFTTAANEAGISRIYGGIHFNSANIDGLATGRALGDYVLQNFLVNNIHSSLIQVGLANDTSPDGTNRDGITSDPTVAGRITAPSNTVRLRAGFGNTPVSSYVDITNNLSADGSFLLDKTQLANIYGASLPDGTYKLYLQIEDLQGNRLGGDNVSFVFDTANPLVSLLTPNSTGDYSTTARLIGSASDTGSRVSSARYSLDGQAFSPLAINNQGQFSQITATSGLAVGLHNLVLEVFDVAGNFTQTTTNFTVANDFLVGPALTEGWGNKTANSITLAEQNSFVTQTAMTVELGQTQGKRQLEFDLNAQFDITNTTAASEDRFLVYLVDSTNPNVTLLDQGEPGTALFSLSGNKAEFTPGLVNYDGRRVQIDLTSLADKTSAQLVFQLINNDSDTGSLVQVQNLINTVDPEGVSGPVFQTQINRSTSGSALPVDSFKTTLDAKLLVNNVRLDTTTGRYTADLQVRNIGTTTLSRQLAVVLTNLPVGVNLLNASGTHPAGSPYINLSNAIQAGGLLPGAVSDTVQIVFNDPSLLRFALEPVFLQGAPDQPPQLDSLGALSVMVGGRLEIPLMGSDPNGDPIAFSIRSAQPLPKGKLSGDGTLIFTPSPDEIGTYNFTLVASSGGLETTQDVTLTVNADPVTTTRISGVIQNTDQAPLAGVVIELGGWQVTTAADGSFLLEFSGPLTSDTLKIRGESIDGTVTYPFIAEKLPLVLEHEVYAGVNNVISRPIYLPPLDTANAHTINPNVDETVTSAALPGSAVFVAANTLYDQKGNLFTGKLSITEVPTNLTPAALPENLHPDLVVTVQPGEMLFAAPAPLTLPNRAGYAPGTQMDLWSINPKTGLFDNVGTGKVSADGSVIETISGGIRNSSWHFFAPPPGVFGTPKDLNKNPRNQDEGCNECEATQPINSEVELHSGAVQETHDLVTYQSLGETRGITLKYNSLRADPRPIVHFGYDDVRLVNTTGGLLVAKLTVKQGDFTYQVPGIAKGQYGLSGGEHFWSLPDSGGTIDAALQADLRFLPSGQYTYELTTGLFTSSLNGTSTTSTGKLININTINSSFGSGWGLAGLQELVKNDDNSVLLIDGDGSQLLFKAPTAPGGSYVSPPGDMSTLVRLADGSFRRTMKDQTTYHFNAQSKLDLVRDRNGNETKYIYNTAGQLVQIVDPVGLATTFTYTGSKVTAITDPAGRITELEYDNQGNLFKVTDPDNSSRSWEYDSEHRMTAAVDKMGNRGEDFYDFAGRVTRAVRPDGSVVQVNPVQTQGLYRPEQTLNPFSAPVAKDLGAAEASYVDGNGNVIRTLLDRAGQTISSTDGAGFMPSVERDANNMVTKSTTARGHATNYTYDDKGNITSIKDELPPGTVVPATPNTNNLFPDRIYDAGSSPKQIVTADLNGDGKLDLVVANAGSDNVSILLGEGQGSFSTPTNFGVGYSPQSVAVGDLNGDGKLDLAVANFNGNNVSILLGDGQGSFSTPTNFGVGSNPTSVAVGDVNRDGKLDLVVANSNSVSVLRGDGQGSFSTSTNLTMGSKPTFATLGDLDSDGDLDIIVATQGFGYGSEGSVSVFLNNGNGSFAPKTDYAVGIDHQYIEMGDVNSDGRLDIITTNGTNQVSVLLNNGNGSFITTSNYVSGPSSIVVGDVNSDGRLDIVTTNRSSNSVSVLLGNGNGTFKAKTDYVLRTYYPSAVALLDVNGDGKVEILTASSYDDTVSVLWNNGDGTFKTKSATTNYSTATGPISVALGDVNGDNLTDFVTANYSNNTVSVGLANGDGTFSPVANYTVGNNPYFVTLGDVNSDGSLDIVTANSITNSVSVLLGNGDGTFSARTDYAVGRNASSVTLGDINSDGSLDLVTANYYENNVSVLLGNGDGSFGARTDYVVGGNPASVVLGDVNGDGKLDLASANVDDDSVSVLLNNGNGIFGNRINYQVGSDPRFVTLGDVNSDGRLDLVATYIGNVSVRLGNGDGTFAAKTDYSVRSWSDVALGDVNGDGKIDLLSSGGDIVSVLLGNGSGSFDSNNRLAFLIGNGTESIALSDLDLDGDLDFVTTSFYENNVSVRLNSTIQQGVGTGIGDRRYTYDPIFNQVTSETDELGRKTLYEIDPLTGNLLSTTKVVGAVGGDDDVVTRYTYTAKGQVDIITDALGRVTDYDYDAFGRLLKVTYAKGTVDEASQQYEYDSAGNQTAIINENRHRTEYKYNAMNQLFQVIEADPDGAGSLTSPITTYTYYADGNEETITDARGNVTKSEYDSMGRLAKTIDAKNGVTTYGYDKAGNLASVVDPLTHETKYRYDARDRLIETIYPDDTHRQQRYDFDSNLTFDIDANNNRTNKIYDARGRLIREINALGFVTKYEYDAANQLVAIIDANEHKTQYKYDDLGRRIEVIDALGHVTKIEYNKVGNVIASTDALGHTTRYTYDNRNRQKVVTDALNNTTTTTYDAVGNVLSITDPVNNTTTFSYDALNRLITETNAFNATRSYSYDAVGNRISFTDRNNRVRQFTYDELNRQKEEKWLDASFNSIRTITSVYDAVGQLTEMGDPDSKYKFTYDTLGRLTSVDNSGTPGVPKVVLNYTHDRQGNVLSVTDTINGELKGTESFSYDALNRVVRMTQSGNGVTNKRVDITYDSVGQMGGLTRYADLAGTQLVASSTYTYDPANRLRNIAHKRGASTLAEYSYDYDEANRITKFTSPDGTSVYSYDDTNQLTGTDHSYQADESYSYDANGNRTNTGYQTGSNNRLFSDGKYNYEYDNEGNRTLRTEIATGEITEYIWDYHNRLTRVVTKNAGNITKQADYIYDVGDRRIAKSVDPDGAGSATATVERFIYDGDRIALTFDGNGTPTHRYLHGPVVDQVLTWENASGSTLWTLTDNLGTVRDLVDSNGTVQNHITYDSFGNVSNQTNPAINTRFDYTGRELDAETGQYYYRARYYDAGVSRFISEDPLGFRAGDTNLYRYVGNKTTSYVDPYGTIELRLAYGEVAPSVPVYADIWNGRVYKTPPAYHADLFVYLKDRMYIYGFDPESKTPPNGNIKMKNPGPKMFDLKRIPTSSELIREAEFREKNTQFVYADKDDTDCKNAENDKLLKIIDAEARRIDASRIPYRASGVNTFFFGDYTTNNSNSAIFTVLRRVSKQYPKLKVPKPDRLAPGWDVDVYSKRSVGTGQ